MTGAARKTSTARVQRHRKLAAEGKLRVVLVLDKAEAEALERARVVQDWNSPAENSEAVAALLRLKLREEWLK